MRDAFTTSPDFTPYKAPPNRTWYESHHWRDPYPGDRGSADRTRSQDATPPPPEPDD